MEFRIALVDDEQSSRTILHGYLKKHCPDAIVVGEAGSVSEAEQLLRKTEVDLLMLDVQMEDGTGFDLLDRFTTWNFNVIFTTAHDEFAVRAFRYNAIDYLLKPIVAEDFVLAVNKAKAQTDHIFRQQQIAQLLDTTATKSFDRITLMTNNGLVFAETQDILRLETYGNYCFVFLSNSERHLISRNLKDFEDILPETTFFRVHQSHIVNMSCVRKFIKDDGGYTVMTDGSKIPVARRRKEEFLNLLKKDFPSISK
jgi:two-component system LytT family response regulator